MFVLATDFGLDGPYIGQVHALLAQRAPGVPVIKLFADLPAFDPRASAYLMAAYMRGFGDMPIFLCVVDPGVGGERDILLLKSQAGWFLAPDNGLLSVVVKRAPADCSLWRLQWRPTNSSATFHARDVIAPAAAMLANGRFPLAEAVNIDTIIGRDWPEDLAEVVYVDHYGNALTGLRADQLAANAAIRVGDQVLSGVRTFSDRSVGEAFWYPNSNGLVEIAVNQGRADQQLGLTIGSPVIVV